MCAYIKICNSKDVCLFNFVDLPVNKFIIAQAAATFSNNFRLFLTKSNDILRVDDDGKNAIHNVIAAFGNKETNTS